jgi:hypothetical protein
MIQFNQQRKIAFIVDCDKVVVTTPYWVAEELLANGRGVLVSFINMRRIARVVIELVGNDFLLNQVMLRAYNYGRAMTWSKPGRAFFMARRPFLHTSVRSQLSMRQ